jgi:hypothetical protein
VSPVQNMAVHFSDTYKWVFDGLSPEEAAKEALA